MKKPFDFVEAMLTCIKTSKYSKNEKLELTSWIKTTIDFGKYLEILNRENEQLKALLKGKEDFIALKLENEQLRQDAINLQAQLYSKDDVIKFTAQTLYRATTPHPQIEVPQSVIDYVEKLFEAYP
jgi:cell shape-determining protein MreC